MLNMPKYSQSIHRVKCSSPIRDVVDVPLQNATSSKRSVLQTAIDSWKYKKPAPAVEILAALISERNTKQGKYSVGINDDYPVEVTSSGVISMNHEVSNGEFEPDAVATVPDIQANPLARVMPAVVVGNVAETTRKEPTNEPLALQKSNLSHRNTFKYSSIAGVRKELSNMINVLENIETDLKTSETTRHSFMENFMNERLENQQSRVAAIEKMQEIPKQLQQLFDSVAKSTKVDSSKVGGVVAHQTRRLAISVVSKMHKRKLMAIKEDLNKIVSDL